MIRDVSPRSTQLHYLTLLEAADLLRRGELSAVELTEYMLARIEAVDPQLHSYARTMPELALQEARVATEQLDRGIRLGPLHGVPVAVKDCCYTAGVPTANGTEIYADFRPDYDASVVRKLRAAGAIILGKLQQTEGAFAEHHASVTPPENPWNPDLWSGASSSGSGVATAAGLCFGSLGTDVGGSIRLPCAVNAVTGVKPTWGRVSRYGIFANTPSLDHTGPMARSAADAAAMMGVLAGADPNDPTAAPDPVPDYLGLSVAGLKGLRVGFDPVHTSRDVDGPTVVMLASAVRMLEELGASVREVRMPDPTDVVEGWQRYSATEMAVAHETTYPSQRHRYGAVLAQMLDLGRAQTGGDYHKVLISRLNYRGRLVLLFQEVDLLVIPVLCDAAPTREKMARLGEDPDDLIKLLRFTAPYNMSGHPTITLPGGRTDAGVSIAFQLVAPHMREELLFRGAIAFQRATDWHRAHPQL
jgi:amidase